MSVETLTRETRNTAIELTSNAALVLALATLGSIHLPLENTPLVFLLGLFWAVFGVLSVGAWGYWLEFRELRRRGAWS